MIGILYRVPGIKGAVKLESERLDLEPNLHTMSFFKV